MLVICFSRWRCCPSADLFTANRLCPKSDPRYDWLRLPVPYLIRDTTPLYYNNATLAVLFL